MLAKILGVIDIITAIFLYVFLVSGNFQSFLLILIALITAKSLFSLKNLFSILDLASVIIILFALYDLTSVLTWVAMGWLFVKGLFSLIS